MSDDQMKSSFVFKIHERMKEMAKSSQVILITTPKYSAVLSEDAFIDLKLRNLNSTSAMTIIRGKRRPMIERFIYDTEIGSQAWSESYSYDFGYDTRLSFEANGFDGEYPDLSYPRRSQHSLARTNRQVLEGMRQFYATGCEPVRIAPLGRVGAYDLWVKCVLSPVFSHLNAEGAAPLPKSTRLMGERLQNSRLEALLNRPAKPIRLKLDNPLRLKLEGLKLKFSRNKKK